MSLTYLSFTLASIRPSKVSMLYTHKPDRASPKSHSWAPEIMLKLYVTNSLGQELYKNTDFFSNLLKPVDNFKFQFEKSNLSGPLYPSFNSNAHALVVSILIPSPKKLVDDNGLVLLSTLTV